MVKCAALGALSFLAAVLLACAADPADMPATAEERAKEARCFGEESPGTPYFNSVCVQFRSVAARLRYENLVRCHEGPTTEYQRGFCEGIDPPAQGGSNQQQPGR